VFLTDESALKEEGELTVGVDDEPMVLSTEADAIELGEMAGKVVDSTGSDIDPISEVPQALGSSPAVK
jgi:hypothetical protein